MNHANLTDLREHDKARCSVSMLISFETSFLKTRVVQKLSAPLNEKHLLQFFHKAGGRTPFTMPNLFENKTFQLLFYEILLLQCYLNFHCVPSSCKMTIIGPTQFI